jgi:hypothetical protein
MLPWLGAYALVLVVWALIIARRPTPTLWKGTALVIVNAVFILATIIYGIARSGAVGTPGTMFLPRSVIIFDVGLILIALWFSRRWLLVGITHEQATEILERCFTQTRSAATRRGHEHVVKCGEIEMIAGIQKNRVAIGNLGLPLPGHVVRFRGAEKSKKGDLIRSLFSKQFGGSFPTPRIKA